MNTLSIRPITPRPGRRALVLLLGLALAGGAAAQWQWRDASGNRVFSDMPPPPGISDSQILKRPAAAGPVAPVTAPTAPAPGAAPAAAATPPGAKPTELDNKVKQAEDQKRKADEQRIAKMKADNCQRARQYKSALDSGQRISRANARGEVEILDEKGLAEEARRNRQDITENCS